MNKKLYIFAVCFCQFSALISAGMADAQTHAEPSFLIQGVRYFSVDALSRQKGLQYRWDPILKNATVSASSGFVKFHVGSEFILHQNGMAKLKDKVRYFQGEVVAPFTASEYFPRIAPEPAAVPVKKNGIIPVTHRIRRIVIDAGHGGHDFGATSPGGIHEKALALSVAKMVANELRQTSIDVVMTRRSDVFIPLPERSKIANDAQSDFFISIHANASTTPSLKGFEVYYLSDAMDETAVALERAENTTSFGSAEVSEPSLDLKALYLDLETTENKREAVRAAEWIAGEVKRSADIGPNRIKSAQFRVLKWTRSPSILIEIGYLTNIEDELKLADPVYQRQLAKAIVRGFMDFKMTFEKTDGFTQ